jgi:ubiquinone/menaquinone biosynthesis C-methylase UbiE
MESQKQLAIEQHSVQADQFAERYVAPDPYASCFPYSRKRLDLLLERYIPARGNGLRILDVGCGTGSHIARYRARGFDVAGIDGSEEMLQRARTLNPDVDLRLSDVDSLPFDDASFDIVLCVEVHRYLPDASKAVAEMARVLKPGGQCLMTATPLLNSNGYWPINRIANAMPMGNLVRLKQFFTTSGRLERQFERAGFSKVEVLGVYTGPINWIERIVPRALSAFLKVWEPIDAKLSDGPLLRDLSNMYLVHARRPG